MINLIVPVGAVKFVVVDKLNNDEQNNTFEITLSKENYSRLTIPPGYWFGFMGIGKNLNLLANIANMEHNPLEVERKEIHEIDYKW